jgi:hypothetical protein
MVNATIEAEKTFSSELAEKSSGLIFPNIKKRTRFHPDDCQCHAVAQDGKSSPSYITASYKIT